MQDTAPDSTLRRSFLWRTLAAAGARFGTVGEAAVALDYGRAPGAEAEAARRLAIADLSPLPRTGFKGPQALAWLGAQGVAIDTTPNRAARQSDGGLACTLSWGEALVLGGLDGGGAGIARLDGAWSLDGAPGVYRVPRRDSHAWFAVTGTEAPAMFAKICGVDLRPKAFPEGAIAQTSIARMNGILARADLGGVPVVHLLADSASAGYLWACVTDAMNEWTAGPVGLSALRHLAGG
jgi:sarcosine oxidase subunit gamma